MSEEYKRYTTKGLGIKRPELHGIIHKGTSGLDALLFAQMLALSALLANLILIAWKVSH